MCFYSYCDLAYLLTPCLKSLWVGTGVEIYTVRKDDDNVSWTQVHAMV